MKFIHLVVSVIFVSILHKKFIARGNVIYHKNRKKKQSEKNSLKKTKK